MSQFSLGIILLLVTNRANRGLCNASNTEGKYISSLILSTNNGFLQGFTRTTINNRTIASFRAIPYGRAPIRFQSPQKPLPWVGIRDASQETPECIQLVEFSELATGVSTIRGQEDCLYLEVNVPHSRLKEPLSTSSSSKLLPVIVYIHGGSFNQGSAAMYGPYYLLDQDIVLVNINYRLGPFGFLSTGNSAAYGNAGMKDQVLALKWVQENIRSFGGNPKSVTIVGESAGAGSVNHHIISPASRGLFHRAISQSGTSQCFWALQDIAPQVAYKTGALVDCQGNPWQLVSCLQRVPAEKLVRATELVKEWNVFPLLAWAPVIEPNHPEAFLSQHPKEIYEQGKAANVPWITGTNREEMNYFFAIYFQNTQAITELNSDWNRYGALFLSLANSTNSPEKSAIATKIKDFYLGENNTEINYANRYAVVKMLTDRHFTTCILDGMYLHAKYTNSPVYAHHFSFKGKYSYVQQYGENPRDWGVSHADDLIYLFNNTQHYSIIQKETDKREYEMLEILTSTWVNFATFGIPYVGGSGNRNSRGAKGTIWKPIQIVPDNQQRNRGGYDVSSFQFLDLNLTPKMIQNPFVERYEFWSSLDI